MSDKAEESAPSGALRALMPNEEVRSVCQILSGFLMLSSRRVVFLRAESKSLYTIERVIPYDCLVTIEMKKEDRATVTGIPLDKYGCHEIDRRDVKHEKTISLNVRAPKPGRGESKGDVRRIFQSSISHCMDIAKEISGLESLKRGPPPPLDYSYLNRLPESLTRDAILDLNTITEDWPDHDELHQKMLKFLGDTPFLLEESLRDGNDCGNGVLFAAGEHGYIWIRGKKDGRLMSDVMIETVEWDNIRCFANQWQKKNASIEATFSLHRDGKEATTQYQWNPTRNEEVLQYPWLIQSLNGPWILADLMYNHSEKPLPASWSTGRHLKSQNQHKQRYYL